MLRKINIISDYFKTNRNKKRTLGQNIVGPGTVFREIIIRFELIIRLLLKLSPDFNWSLRKPQIKVYSF